MSTRHVILGLIREQPGHTYDVAVRFGRRLKPWQVNRGQVYRTVATLERDGLIEAMGDVEAGSRSGPSWRLTDAGCTELDRWFATLCEDVEPLRGDLLAKLAVAEPEDAPTLLTTLDWYERALTAQLEEDVRARRAAGGERGWSHEVADLISDGAILHRDAELQWVRRVRELLHDWAARSADGQGRDDVVRAIAPGGRVG